MSENRRGGDFDSHCTSFRLTNIAIANMLSVIQLSPCLRYIARSYTVYIPQGHLDARGGCVVAWSYRNEATMHASGLRRWCSSVRLSDRSCSLTWSLRCTQPVAAGAFVSHHNRYGSICSAGLSLSILLWAGPISLQAMTEIYCR